MSRREKCRIFKSLSRDDKSPKKGGPLQMKKSSKFKSPVFFRWWKEGTEYRGSTTPFFPLFPIFLSLSVSSTLPSFNFFFFLFFCWVGFFVVFESINDSQNIVVDFSFLSFPLSTYTTYVLDSDHVLYKEIWSPVLPNGLTVVLRFYTFFSIHK